MALRWVMVSGPVTRVRASFFLMVTVVWYGGAIAAMRAKRGSADSAWGERVSVAKAEREEGSFPVMVVAIIVFLLLFCGGATKATSGCRYFFMSQR